MVVKCVLFDADGIIITSDRFSVQYQKKYDVSNDEMLPFFKGEFQNCLIGKADLRELLEPWLSRWKWEGSVDELLQFWFECQSDMDQRVIDIIGRLKKEGIKCYLVTNQEKYRVGYMKKELGFEELFDRVFSSADIGSKKPEREFFEFVLDKIKDECDICPDEIMFFDDSKGHVDEAKKLGIDAYFYENFEEFKELVKPLFGSEVELK